MINTSYRSGGAAGMAAALVNALNAGRYASAVLIHSDNAEMELPALGLKRPASRQLNALGARLLGSHHTFDLGFASSAGRVLRHTDVMHLHNPHGYYLNYRKLLMAWRPKPIVWTWHDMWGATGRCAFAGDCGRWKEGCPSCPNLDAYPAAWIDNAASEFEVKKRLFLSYPNLWIASPSRWLAQIAIDAGYRRDRISVIPNPSSLSSGFVSTEEARGRLNIGDSSYVALFVAADCNDPRKGYLDFCFATEGLHCRSIAVGRPPLTPASHVEHVGLRSSKHELADYFAAADVLVVPSYADNYPNTVIEAACCGTPVIGYAAGGVPEQLDIIAGRSVAVGSRAELREAVRYRVSAGRTAESERHELVRRSRHWSPDVIAESYAKLYNTAHTFSFG